jgi:hypothetical protein
MLTLGARVPPEVAAGRERPGAVWVFEKCWDGIRRGARGNSRLDVCVDAVGAPACARPGVPW